MMHDVLTPIDLLYKYSSLPQESRPVLRARTRCYSQSIFSKIDKPLDGGRTEPAFKPQVLYPPQNYLLLYTQIQSGSLYEL